MACTWTSQARRLRLRLPLFEAPSPLEVSVPVRRKLPAALALTALLLTSACGSSSGDDSSTKGKSATSASSAVKVSGKIGTVPTVKFSTPLKVSKTSTEVVTEGDGAKLADGKMALVHLFLENGTTGKPIGSTYDQGTPTSVVLDSTSLPQPLITALDGKPQGSRVAVTSTAADIYGESGNASLNLKATDSLVMVFDILAVQPNEVLSGPKGASKPLPSGLPKPVEKDGKISTLDFTKAAKTPAKKLQVIPLVTGTGPKTTKSSVVTMNYIGQVYGKKQPFNNTYAAGKPATFPLGVNGLIKAWDEALVGVPVGSRVMLVAPSSLAYGKEGSKDAGIPKNATLVFVVDILGSSS
ncbi:MAG: hypothetical protein JWR85_2724 [Marmoricola sp.]|nr:hypothetical protein [Marmoricola sp.]